MPTQASITILLATDHSGSVLNAVDTTKNNSIAYTPYGDSPTDGGQQSQLRFNGVFLESTTGCYLLGNGYRMYNPRLMRFLSPDGWSPFRAGWLNAYAYCGGDPRNRYDSDGHAFRSRLWRPNRFGTFKPLPKLNSASSVSTPASINEGSIIYDVAGSNISEKSFSSGYASIKSYKSVDGTPQPPTRSPPESLRQVSLSDIGPSNSRRGVNPMHELIYGVTYHREAYPSQPLSVDKWVESTLNVIPDEPFKASGRMPAPRAGSKKNLVRQVEGIREQMSAKVVRDRKNPSRDSLGG
ncbi:RHS repeat-associated core domain-containing protein [Pseudomonas sp. GW101-3H06]|jgi:RHS repeat-associated protein|uniref:RHS repeat-associated core domain-containing protein n=1 Tax=Pseudomonas sp. GW101-3H06 TaxID=2751347 RepID=UPI001A9392CC|nr:RHS repeat-associated core domain-containing protein [Pseudomonas sp. GW101-3H06]